MVGADVEPRHLVGADHVDHGHRNLDGHPGGERGIGGDGVDVPVVLAVPHQLGEGVLLAEQGVDEAGSGVAVCGEQLSQPRTKRTDRGQLGCVTRAGPGEPVLVEVRRELVDGGHGVGCGRGVHQRHGGQQRRLGVMSENHIDRLHDSPLASCVMATMTHDTTQVVGLRRARAGLAFAVLAAASFGLSGALAAGLLSEGWSPAALVVCRLGVGALALLGPALVALRGRWSLLRANAGFLLSFGLVAGAGVQFAYFNAIERLPVAIAILIEYAAPLAVVGWLWARHRQTPSRLTVLGAAVAIGGLLLVLDVFAVGSVDGLGVLWALGGMVGCAFFFVVSSGEDNGLPPIVLATGGLVVGTIALGLAGVLGFVDMSAGTAQYSRCCSGYDRNPLLIATSTPAAAAASTMAR